METVRVILIVSLVLALSALARPFDARGPLDRAPGEARAMPVIDSGARSAGFTFGPSVTAPDRAAIETAVSSARPEAQRLIAIVDGLTTIDVGTPEGGAAGTATDLGDRYEVLLDLHAIQQMGVRGVNRLVLHELAHVVDYALVDDELLARLDEQIPDGWVCEEGELGACAADEERFAETFAKWATGDIGVDIYLGYKVPPPSVPLDAWGAPLSGLEA